MGYLSTVARNRQSTKYGARDANYSDVQSVDDLSTINGSVHSQRKPSALHSTFSLRNDATRGTRTHIKVSSSTYLFARKQKLSVDPGDSLKPFAIPTDSVAHTQRGVNTARSQQSPSISQDPRRKEDLLTEYVDIGASYKLPNGSVVVQTANMQDHIRVLSTVPHNMLWCGEQDGGLNCREADTGEWINWIKPPEMSATSRCFPTCMTTDACFKVWIGNTSGTIDIFDGYSAMCEKQLVGHQGQVRCLLSVEEMKAVLSGGNDFSVACWDIFEYVPLWKILRHDNNVTALAVSPPIGISATDSGQVRFWNFQGEQSPPRCTSIRPHRRAVSALMVSYPYAFSASQDGTVRILSLINYCAVRTLHLGVDIVPTSLGIAGETLWIGSTDGILRFVTLAQISKGKEVPLLAQAGISNHCRSAITGIVPVRQQTLMLFHVLTSRNEVHTYLHQPAGSTYEDRDFSLTPLTESMAKLHVSRSKLWELTASIAVAKDKLRKNAVRLVNMNQMIADFIRRVFRHAERSMKYQKLISICTQPRQVHGEVANAYTKVVQREILRRFYEKLYVHNTAEYRCQHYRTVTNSLLQLRSIAIQKKIYELWKSRWQIEKKRSIAVNKSQALRSYNARFTALSAFTKFRRLACEHQRKKALCTHAMNTLKYKSRELSAQGSFLKWARLTKSKVTDAVPHSFIPHPAVGLQEYKNNMHSMRTTSSYLHRANREEFLHRIFISWMKAARQRLARNAQEEGAALGVEIAQIKDDLEKNARLMEQADPVEEISVTRERITKTKKDLEVLAELLEELESEHSQLKNQFDQKRSPAKSRIAQAESQHDFSDPKTMMSQLTLLKAKSVLCKRDLKEIKKIREAPTKDLPRILQQGITDCATHLHQMCETEYQPRQGDRWDVIVDPSSGGSQYIRREVLRGIRKAIIARDCIAQRDDAQSTLTNSIAADLTREIIINLDFMISCVDVFTKGHIFYAQSKLASSIEVETRKAERAPVTSSPVLNRKASVTTNSQFSARTPPSLQSTKNSRSAHESTYRSLLQAKVSLGKNVKTPR